MGEALLRYYREKTKKESKMAFVSAFVITLLIHLYKFTNYFPNRDSVLNYYADQNVLGSGRWALSWACGISSFYDLPWVIGIFSCFFIALTVVVIVSLFKIKNPVLIVLVGAFLAASPATTETFFFLYTADGYMIAMALSALAVYTSRIEENRISRWICSGVCICMACGIYQAYVSFALLLALCYFMDVLLDNRHSKTECLKWILRQTVIYAAALAAYYLIWNLCMHISGISANDYQGISQVGTLRASFLKDGLIQAVRTVVLYLIQWNILKHGFTLYNTLNLIVLAFFAVGSVVACARSGVLYRKWAFGLIVLCLVAIIPFACIWHFVSASVDYRPMMLQSLSLLFIFVALIYEKWAKSMVKDILCLLLVLIVFNNALMANVSYSYMERCYERTYAEGMEMMADIHAIWEDHQIDQIAVLGTRYYDVNYDNTSNTSVDTTGTPVAGKLHILSSLLEKSLLYDSAHTLPFLRETFGLELPSSLDRQQRNQLLKSEQVAEMGCWPAGDSMTVIDNILIIKLSDIEEGT